MSTINSRSLTQDFIENAIDEELKGSNNISPTEDTTKTQSFKKDHLNEVEDDTETTEGSEKMDIPKSVQEHVEDQEATGDCINSVQIEEQGDGSPLENITNSEVPEPLDNEAEEENPDSDTIEDEWQDILGSGAIKRKILKQGEPDMRPTRNQRCLINYKCSLENADEGVYVEEKDNLEIELGGGDVVQGLDVAIALMNKHERSLLEIQPRLAYGDKGLPPNIPSDATVLFNVELVDVKDEEECDNWSIKQRKSQAYFKRTRGNFWYERGNYTSAIQCYRRALEYLDEVDGESNNKEKPSNKELQEILEDRLVVLNNMASAQIKMELYDQALVSLQIVLRCQPDNVKALYRKAKVHIAKNDLPQALKLLEKAKELAPEDKLINKEISAVNKTINKQKNSEREYAQRMFAGQNKAADKPTNEVRNKKDGSSSIYSLSQVILGVTFTALVGLVGVLLVQSKK